MDPSYGGCAVLRVALDELADIGAVCPKTMIFGADIDGVAADWAAHLVSQGVPNDNLRSADFFSLTPGDELPKVAAVVGNPPYVRHHAIDPTTRLLAANAMDAAGATISGRASLWAYFVIHSCRFVEPGGRLALLLPGAVLQADYAPAVIDFVARHFSDVLLVRVSERLFPDADEETVVLLASDAHPVTIAGKSNPDPRIAEVRDLEELELLLNSTATAGKGITSSIIEGIAPWKATVVAPEAWSLFVSLLQDERVSRLGDVAQVSLGTVTGANDFFLISGEVAEDLGVSAFCTPAVGRSAWLRGLDLTEQVLASEASLGRGQLLMLPPDMPIDGRTRLGRYIAAGELDGLHVRRHCRREPWWSLGDVSIPDAFLPYTVGSPRGLVRNSARAASTNTVHQVTWSRPFGDSHVRSWIATSWSALGRLGAELFGRHYGGGVLKLELADAQRLPLAASLKVTESEFRACLGSNAITFGLADAALLHSPLGLDASDLSLLNSAADSLAQRRVSSRTAGSKLSPVGPPTALGG